MLRILLLLEDYGEIMFLSTALKKIGFDVEGIQNPRLFDETFLKMNPDMMILTAFGKRVRGLELIRKKKPPRGWPRIVMLYVPGQSTEHDPDVSAWLQSPVPVGEMLNTIGDLSSLDKNQLQEKFKKLRYEEQEPDPARILKSKPEDEESFFVQGEDREPESLLAPTSISREERRNRYKKFLEDKPPEQHLYAVQDVKDYVKNIRQSEKDPEKDPETDDLEKQRRALVKEMFKKKP